MEYRSGHKRSALNQEARKIAGGDVAERNCNKDYTADHGSRQCKHQEDSTLPESVGQIGYDEQVDRCYHVGSYSVQIGFNSAEVESSENLRKKSRCCAGNKA